MTKNNEIMFSSDEHKELYLKILEEMRSTDEYHKSTAYLIALDNELTAHLNDVFDLDQDVIKHTALNQPWQTGTSIKTTRLLFNLWNSFMYDSTEDFENDIISRYYSIDEIFSSCLALYYFEAVKLRFNISTPEQMTLTPSAASLLKKITQRENKEVKQRFAEGTIDFTPEEHTEQDVLMQILCGYALKNCPELLQTEEH